MSNLIRMNNIPKSDKIITLKEIPTEPDLSSHVDEHIDDEEKLDSIQDKIQQAEEQLEQIKEQQEQLVLQTEEIINREKATWVEEKEFERQEAKEHGYQVGFEAGKEEAEKQFNELIKKANDTYRSSIDDYHATVKKHKETIIQLAIKTAEKVIRDSLEIDPNYILNIVEGAIDGLKDKSEISIYIHPNDYDIVFAEKRELEQMTEGTDLIIFQMNEEINQGYCVIKHRFGQIDASIDTQLEEIKRVLQEQILES